MKKLPSLLLAGALLVPSLGLAGCGGQDAIVLKVYSWEEYIDEGGNGTFIFDELHELDSRGEPVKDGSGAHVHIESDIVDDGYKAWYEQATGIPLSEEGPAILDDFELWYAKTYPDRPRVRVEYSTFGTNEDMYNEIKLGNRYDLLCPSDYMIMKLAAEGYLEKYDESFLRTEGEGTEYNYYAKNVSPFIAEKFENNAGLAIRKDPDGEEIYWKDYAAGYMWGTTGFVYDPEATLPDGTPLEERLAEKDWKIFTDNGVQHRITAKDNVRDTYFAALGVVYEEELQELRRQYEAGELSRDDYIARITERFNATDESAIGRVEPVLAGEIKDNLFSFETDTGKADMVNGNIDLYYAWSGDAVYALDLAESENDKEFCFFVPQGGSNLWFDGWVMPKGIDPETKHAAQAFVNFLSIPQNAMRNSYYIGYTSVIAGENGEMLDYCDYLYGVDEEEAEDPVEYDLGYFFGEGSILAERENAERRQLFAQFPPESVISRCAVMDYYDEAATERINELWSHVKSESLDLWAILVICLAVTGIALFTVFVKFGGKIDFFRRKPKKGYRRVNA